MGKLLSVDLRRSVVAAVADSLSRRAAAERFGVSSASAVRWVQAVKTIGSVEAKLQGGDTRSRLIEAFGAVILGAFEEHEDISTVDTAELLRAVQGASFTASSVRRSSTAMA